MGISGDYLPDIDVRHREGGLFKALEANSIDFLFVPDLTNVRWLTGFTGSAGCAVVDTGRREVHLMTDSRYRDQSSEELSRSQSRATVHLARTSSQRADVISRVAGGAPVSVDPAEVTVLFHRELSTSARTCELSGPTPFKELRRAKDSAEIARITRAASVADSALQEVVADGLCGLSEREVKVRLEYAMARGGADGISFDTIVASGPNAAMPHHSPAKRVIEAGDMVIIDMGALVDGYHSDMTRTIAVGELSEEMSRDFELVLAAQSAGTGSVRAGVRGDAVDHACREVFERSGVEDLYIHGTGHGVGLAIHEEPFFHKESNQRLSAGEVVTIEPGLYRMGVSGVRIEDLVLVTESGCQILSTSPKELSCPPSPRTT